MTVTIAGIDIPDTELAREATERVGYGSPETLRRAFVARLGVSPSAYQQRFRSAQRRDAAAPREASRTR